MKITIDLQCKPIGVEILEKIIETAKEARDWERENHKKGEACIELKNIGEGDNFFGFLSEITRGLFGFNIPMPEQEPLDVGKGKIIKTKEGYKKIIRVRKADNNENLFIINTQDLKPEELQNN